MQQLAVNGKKIEFYSNHADEPIPEKPIILFIHGAGGSCHLWVPLIDSLDSSINALAISLTGHGNSIGTEEPSLSTYLKDVEDVISTLPSPPFLCGHSMGGAIALQFALQNPDKISGLILVSTGARLKVAPMIFQFLEQDPAGYLKSSLKFMFSREFRKNQKKKIKQFVEELAPLMTPEITKADFQACNSFDVMDKIQNIQKPTLIIVGSDDFMTPPKYSQYLNEKIPKSSLKIIEGPGHLITIEKPREVAEIITEFVFSL
ncbi:MAG: alpha/beta fold hydrolase [Candidatus Helarchaeales archaeon]